MNGLQSVLSAIVPVGLIALLLYARLRGVRVFSAFLNGAADALPMLKTMLPCLAAMLTAITLLRDSGLVDAIISVLAPLTERIALDARLLPLILLRPLSGSAAVAVLSDLFAAYGADSTVGLCGSVLLGASETLLYTLGLYFGSVGVRKTRFTVPLALIATLVSIVMGLLFSKLFFG